MYSWVLSLLFIISVLLLSFIYILHAAVSNPKHHKDGRKLPPGPPRLPIIGNLHILVNLPHQTLHNLSLKYGPIMSLTLGSVPTIVVSSSKAAELFLKTHDTVFASRPKAQFTKYFTHGSKGLAFAPYGPYWRNVRKICTLQLLSASKVESFAPTRRTELGSLVECLKKAAVAKEVVDVSNKVGELIEDVMCKMILGRKNDERFNFKPLIRETLHLAGAFNLSDYVPFLAKFDLQGLEKRFKSVGEALDQLLETIINEHLVAGQQNQMQKHDFVQVLLSMLDEPIIDSYDKDVTPEIIGLAHVKAIILDMIAAAIDAASTAIEWALAEILRHPQVKQRLQSELESVFGVNRLVEESELAKLSYLDLVIKESLRLHPVAPLLIPHESMEDIEINGYYIPKRSRILVNIWGIGRNTKFWSENAGDFLPERFVEDNMDYRGKDFKFMPFGTGRRGCPGMQLALVTVKLVVAQFLHCFDWELPNGMLPRELDMEEKFGLSLPRANHLLAKPTYRLSI